MMSYKMKEANLGRIIIIANRVRMPGIDHTRAVHYLQEQFRATFDPPATQNPFEIQS